MNTNFRQDDPFQEPYLYQEPAAGVHFFMMRKNRVPISFKSQSTFLSTGNFDQIIEEKKAPNPKNFISCGNFVTSTKKEDWDTLKQDSKVLEFKSDSLKHSPRNVKYNLEGNPSNLGNKPSNRNQLTTGINPEQGYYAYTAEPAPSSFSKLANMQDVAFNKAQALKSARRTSYQEHEQPALKTIQEAKHKKKKVEGKPTGGEDSDDSECVNEYELESEGESEARLKTSPEPDRQLLQQLEEDLGLDEEGEEEAEEEEILEPEQPPQDPLVGLYEEIKAECLNQLLNKKVTKRADDTSMIVEDMPLDSGDYSLADLLEMTVQSKESSMLVQSYLKCQSKAKLNAAAGYLMQHLDEIVLNKFGNYVIQYLVEIHKPSLEYTAKLTLFNFVKYAENEYGSRIMQKLSTLSPHFCYNALRLFWKYFDHLIKNITGSILLSKLISAAPCEDDFAFVLGILDTNKDYLRKAYFNRMLSTLVSCCSEHMLDQVVAQIKNHIWVLMNDKFGNYVLQIIVERGHGFATNLIKTICLKNYNIILIRKYPKFLLIKITELDVSGQFCSEMIYNVVNMEAYLVLQIFEKRDSSMLFLLFLSKLPPAVLQKTADKLLKLLSKGQQPQLPHSRLR
jgi:Pumilio-family RNA binding repeat